MTVTNVLRDPSSCSMTVTAEFDAAVDRVWQLWADPRQLERWWGPPAFPATCHEHNITAGGQVKYFMTSPEGEKFHGLWRVLEVQAPRLLVVEDAFADDTTEVIEGMPLTIMRVELSARPEGGTRVLIHSTFPSVEAMEQLMEMGMDEGMREAMGQMDAILLD